MLQLGLECSKSIESTKPLKYQKIPKYRWKGCPSPTHKELFGFGVNDKPYAV